MRLELVAAMLSLSSCRAFLVPRSVTSSRRSRSLSFLLSPRLDGLDKPTVWHEFSPLANEYNAVNLGQGFPDWDPPEFVIEAMRTSISTSGGRHANQYARSYAHLPLAQVLAEDYTKRWDISIDPATQVGTAVGCTNALYCALQGLVSPGDDVLLLEPAFDIVRVDNGCGPCCCVGSCPHFFQYSILHR
jgi:DNA-binding transcriptional MocR family regulator